MERVVCRWPTCGVILYPKERTRFVVCGSCRHVTCLSCDASHEGTNCGTFRTQSMIPPTDTPVRTSGDVRACGDAQGSLQPLRSQQIPSPRTSLAGGSPGITAPQTSPRKEARSPVAPNSPFKQTPTPRTSLAGASPGVAATQTGPGKATRSPVSPVKTPSPRTSLAGGSPARAATETSPRKEAQSPVSPAKPNSQVKARTPIGAGCSPPSTVQPSTGAAFSQSVWKQATSPRPQRTVQCASEDCGYEISVDVDETELPCYKCRNTTCLLCNAIHRDLTCEDYQKQLKPPVTVQEEEIQVRCAGVRCHFIAYVGVSALQLSCPLCECITCIQCRAVHEFETCVEYEANRRRRCSTGEAQSRPVTASTLAVETEQRLHISESSAGSRPGGGFSSTRPEEVLPPFVASSEVPARRDAPRQDAMPVQRAASEAQPANEAVMVECCHCLVESSYEEITEVSSCGHFLCTECVHEAAVNSLTYLVLCPVAPQGSPRCQSHIQESALKKAMSPAEHGRRKELLALPILRCPVEGCSGKFCARPGVQKIDCPSCNNEFCVPCSASHPGSSCEQFIRVVAGTDAAVRRPMPADSSDGEDDGEDVVVGASTPTDSD